VVRVSRWCLSGRVSNSRAPGAIAASVARKLQKCSVTTIPIVPIRNTPAPAAGQEPGQDAPQRITRVRRDYNDVRLHQGIGYVTPNDDHEGRGDAIREARIEGLRRAHDQRVAYHRRTTTDHPEETS